MWTRLAHAEQRSYAFRLECMLSEFNSWTSYTKDVVLPLRLAVALSIIKFELDNTIIDSSLVS